MRQALAGVSPWRARGLAVASGAVGALALPPFDLWPLLFPTFSLILALLGAAPTLRSAMGRAWWAGLGWFGVTMHWIVQPFFVEPEIFGWMAPFALVFLAGGLSLFWMAAAAIAARLCSPGVGRIWAMAGALTLAEAARGRVFTGLPWAQPGHGLIGSEALVLSTYLGPLGLTLVAMVFAAATASLLISARPAVAAVPLMVGVALGVAPLAPAAPTPLDDAPVVRLVQINAPQHLKWLPDQIPLFFQRGLDLSAAPSGPLGPPDLVVWPETSLPDILGRSETARDRIATAAGEARVLIGGQRYSGIEPRNMLASLTPDGSVAQVYDKHHLVPFGEYLPLRGLADRLGLSGLAAQLAGGYYPGAGPGLLDLGALGQAFPMICYEAIFPRYLAQVERPDFMVAVTNDAWFGSFAMPYQHLALARLRAAEQGLPVVRVANTGVSAVIDARGDVVASLAMDMAGHLDVQLPAAAPPTPFSRSGPWVTLFLAAAMVVSGAALSWVIEPGRKAA